MGFFCRCKQCGVDFVDQYGEYVNNDNQLECPICGSTELYVDDEIPDDPPFNDISMEEVEIIKTQIVDHLELLITEPLTDERKKIIDDIHNYLIKWRNEKDN